MSDNINFWSSDSVYRTPAMVSTGNTLVCVCTKSPSWDDYGYIELVAKISEDGGKSWSEEIVIASPPAREIAEISSSKSAFFTDPCLALAPNGDIILLATFFPESKGYMDTKLLENKTAFAGFDGGIYPIIYDREGNYYIVLDSGDIISSKKKNTIYKLRDMGELYKGEEYIGNIYLNGAMGKSENDKKTTFGAPLKAPKRSYIFMFKSTDGGKTWDNGRDITRDIFADGDGFLLGVSAGSALTAESGRIIVPLHTQKNTVCIYSDDNGETWQRNKRLPYTDNSGEWTAVQAENGDIYSFGSAKGKVPVSVSKDNGITWFKDKKADFKAPKCQKNALKIGSRIFVSHPEKAYQDGVISSGEYVFDKKGNVKKIKWSKDGISIKDEFFANSCLAKIDNNTLGVIFEDSADTVSFKTIKI